MKFCFRINDRESDDLDEIFLGLNKAVLIDYIKTMRAGDRMHLIVRPRPGFDVEAMRNLFHGPWLDWICDRLHEMGLPHGREQVREEIKRRFMGVDDNGKPRSMTELERMTDGDPRDPETKYKTFLNEVKLWCIDIFNCEPPRQDEADLGEERSKCATPEMII